MTYVYNFKDGSKDMKDLLGGKGANLAEMTNLGLPVPAGFTITTEACLDYLNTGKVLSDLMKTDILQAIKELETISGKVFNSRTNPLFVSVRSGSKFSMPGMMDTILNLGLTDETVVTLAEQTGNEVFAYDCYQRLLKMFGEIVYSIPKHLFDEKLTLLKAEKHYTTNEELTVEDWKELVRIYKTIFMEATGQVFPQSAEEQLFAAVEAVFRSWLNPRAKTYRRLHDISESLGTAVNIQEMVFGNTGEFSGTGVCFTRNPSTGQKGLFGEYLINAQGEDVVAGIRTPELIATLADVMPEVYQEFHEIAMKLEKHYQDMQDIEFTIENKKLFILQTRNGKRTAKAAFAIATDLVEEGLITKTNALQMVDTNMIHQLLHPVFQKSELEKHVAFVAGLPASPGASSGKVYFTAEAAKTAHDNGEQVILLRQETSPEDIEGMIVSEAIVTSRGGMTSHAAVVARGMGVCAVVGCETLKVNEDKKQVEYEGGTIKEGEILSVDGNTGKLYLGILEKEAVEEQQALNELLLWADEVAKMEVRANAETPEEIETALKFGVTGIGLARTEHMFFGEERVFEMRKMILAQTSYDRLEPLKRLKEYQKADFKKIYTLMKDLPVTVRLLDPPLHEFLPHMEEDMATLADSLQLSLDTVKHRVEQLQETNPMLGHRGCRLAITYPEIYITQAEAIIEAALEVSEELHVTIVPEIMIPLIATEQELHVIKESIVHAIEKIFATSNNTLDYQIGTMIEIPRTCMIADKIAENSDFFSFGTNDLTQLMYGFSRDDIGKFVGDYLAKDILTSDPFQTIDPDGVGELVRMGVEKGRAVKPDLKIGVCGELGGDPTSIKHFGEYGLSYVSCSPFRVPIARLAAAQAVLMD